MSKHTFFVSHVTEDSQSAIELAREIERRGFACWIAPRDVVPGSRFDDQIADAIDDCSAFLLIFSDRCNDSDYIFRELTVAGEAHKPVIPIRIENCKPRRGLRVRLSDLHWIDAFAARGQAIDAIIRTLGPSASDRAATQAEVPAPSAFDSSTPTGKRARPPAATAPQSPAAPPADAPIGPTLLVNEPTAAARPDVDDMPFEATSLDEMRSERRGARPDDAEAVKWFRKAADQGDPDGQVNLGRMYAEGRGVPRDDATAVKWYLKAADQGDTGAERAFQRLKAGLPPPILGARVW